MSVYPDSSLRTGLCMFEARDKANQEDHVHRAANNIHQSSPEPHPSIFFRTKIILIHLSHRAPLKLSR